MKKFEEIVREAIGKRVRMNIVVQENPPLDVEGKLLEINNDHIVIEDCFTHTKLYINAGFSAILTIEILGE